MFRVCQLGDERHDGGTTAKEVLDWCRRAAEENLPEAQFAYARRYAKGDGVLQNGRMAARWLARAADNGHAQARQLLAAMMLEGNGVPKDPKGAARLFRLAAEAGDVQAKLALGSMYHEGIGVERSATTAFDWFVSAAEQGNAQAQFLAGWACETGDGTPRDTRCMLHWYHEADAQGIPEARLRLGIVYSIEGRTTKRPEEAHYYLSSALRSGIEPARKLLETLEKGMDAATLSRVRKSTENRLRNERQAPREPPSAQEKETS